MRFGMTIVIIALISSACSTGDQGVDWCDTAKTWRDAVQDFEAATNRADRSTPAGRTEMHDAFATLANVTLPVVADGEDGAPLREAMVEFTDTAESWLSSGSRLFTYADAGVRGDPAREAFEEYEAKRLELNAAFRNANSHLVAACDLEPITLYTTEGSSTGSLDRHGQPQRQSHEDLGASAPQLMDLRPLD